jgi:hypothetical protein
MATEIWTFQDRRLGQLDLTGFAVETRDGVIGRVDRATRDVARSYLVIDPGPAMPLGRRVVLPAGMVDTVDLDDRRLSVSVGRNEILSAPEFDPDRPLDESLRDSISSHFASPRGQQRSPARSTRRQPAKRAASRPRPAKGRARASTSDEPTKDDLYQQAKRLNIEGRSKMNKTQLKRAIARRK